jgi:hypothetical protein
MRLGTCNVRNPYEAEPFRTVARELQVHRLAFVGAQIKWDNGGTESAEDYIFLMEREMKIIRVSGFLYIRESNEQLRK